MTNERTNPTIAGCVVPGVLQTIQSTSGMLMGMVPKIAVNVRDRSRKTATTRIMRIDVIMGKVFCSVKQMLFSSEQESKRLGDKEIERVRD